MIGLGTALRQLPITSAILSGPQNVFNILKSLASFRFGGGSNKSSNNNVVGAVNAVATTMAAVAKIAGNTPNIGSLTKLTTSFSQVIGAMKRLTQLSDILPNDLGSRLKRKLGIGDISGPLRSIEFVAKELARIAGSIPNLQGLNKLGNALEGLGIGITKIVGLANILPFGFRDRIKRLFGLDDLSRTVGVIAKLSSKLASAASGMGNISDFSKFGSALEGIGKFISAINRTNLGDVKGSKLSQIPLLGRLFTQSKFKQVINVIKEIASAFKGLKGVAVPDFSTLLPALVNFSQQAQQVDFKKTNLKGFVDFTKQLAKGLKELSNAKIDTAKLAAIGASLSGLAGFKGLGGGGLQNAQVTQATSAARGIIENAAGQFIGQVAFSVLSRLQTFIGKLLNFSSSIRGALQSVGQSLNAFGLNAERVGKSLIQNFGLGQLANSPLVGIAADFDHLSNELQVFGNLTDEQLKHAQAFADEIGKKYPASSNEALQAILDLTQAGQDLNSIEFILPGAADLAILGSIDIPQATGALITATSVFDKFTDSVAATSDNVGVATTQFSNFDVVSRATIPGLIEGLTNVAPAAQLFKLNLQETLAGLAEFNDAGILGAEAGTQLAQVLNALTKPQAKEAFASLNDELAKIGSNIRVSIADAHGNLLPFDTIIKNLGGAFKELGLSEVQVLDVLSQIAGSRAKLGFATLIRDNGIQAMIDKTAELGTAAERAQVILNDFKGDVDQLKGSVETLNKNALLPLLQKSLRPFVKVARQIVDGLLGLPQSFFDLASNIIFVASSLATLVGSALIAIGVLAKFEGLLFRLGGSLIGLVTHLPALITGVVGFVAALGMIIVVATAVAAVIGGAALVLGGFRDVIERDIGHAGGAFRQFQAAITFMADRVGIVLNAVGRVITLIFGGTAQQEVQDFGTRVADFFNRLTIGSLSLFDTLEQVTAFFENFGNFVEVGFGHSSATQIAFFEDQLRKLSTFPLIRAIFGRNATPTGLRNVFRDVFAFFTKLKTAVENVFSGAVGVLFGEPGAIQRVHAGVAGLLSVISGLLKNATGLDLSSAILNFDQGKIGAGVTAFFVTVLGKVRDWFVQNRDAIINAVGDVLSFATGATFGAASFILRVLGLDAAADTVQRIGDTLSDLIHRAVNLAIRLFAGQPLIDASGVQKVIDTIIGDPIAFLNSVAETVSALITSALEQVPALLGDIGQRLNIAPLIDLGVTLENSAAFDQVATALGNIAGYPFDAAGKMFDGISALFESGNFTNGLAISGVLVALNALTNTGGLIALFSSLRAILFGAVLPVVGLVTLVSAL
ncbi:MAG: phage tail tape measure protein, partial [Chloroflexota bacterium]